MIKLNIVLYTFLIVLSLLQVQGCILSTASDSTQQEARVNSSYQMVVVNQSEWEVGKIASGILPHLVFDSQGIPHLSFHDGWRVRYATIENTTWTATPLEATEHGHPHAISVDALDRPHIAYIVDSQVVLATYDEGDWSKEIVLHSVDTDKVTLALDQNTRRIVAFYDRTSHDIICVRQRDTAWDEIVASAGRWGGSLSLCIDSLNNPHISFCDSTDFTLKYARWNGTSWLMDTIDTCQSGSNLLGIAMVLDAQDHPHIAYTSYNQKLKYAVWNGSRWYREQVHYIQVDVKMVSLCLDAFDRPHIGLLQRIHGPINEIMYITYNGTGWQKSLIATDVGWHGVTIAYNPQTDQPTIIFQDEDDDSLYFATQDSWVVHEADIRYYLTVDSAYGDPVGEGWYPIGSVVTVSVTTPSGFLVQYVFTGWTGDITSSSPSTIIVMNADKTVIANWTEDYTQLLGLGVGLGIIASVIILVERRQRNTL